jgi:hypothetical protein
MTSSGIDPDQDPLKNRFRVEELERVRWEEERRRKQEAPQEPSPEDEPGLSAFLVLIVEKSFDLVKGAIKKGLFGSLKEPIRNTLLLLKASFEMMMKEDVSQDTPFLQNLSELWQEALAESVELENSPTLSTSFKTLIRDIETHPEGEEHTFGYYLTEYAGQRWLPFPYMELIRKLHRQHSLDPASSLLTRWTALIEEILNRS